MTDLKSHQAKAKAYLELEWVSIMELLSENS